MALGRGPSRGEAGGDTAIHLEKTLGIPSHLGTLDPYDCSRRVKGFPIIESFGYLLTFVLSETTSLIQKSVSQSEPIVLAIWMKPGGKRCEPLMRPIERRTSEIRTAHIVLLSL